MSIEKQATSQQQTHETEIPPLSTLYFYLSEGCNLACSHCWLSPAYDPDGKKCFLSVKLFKKIIREALPLGLTAVKLTGGEPLLHPDILDILDIVYQEQLELIVETNGTLCTPKLAENISKQLNPFVSVSLDAADAATNDRLRGVTGAFDKTIRAIKTLTEKKVPTQIIMSLMQDNVRQIGDMIALAEYLQVTSLKFNLLQPVGRGQSLHNASKAIPLADLIALEKKVDGKLTDLTPLQLYFDCPPVFKSLKNITPESNGCSICGILSILGVLASGEYALCGIGSQVDQLIFGRAGKKTLSDVWRNNPIIKEIRSGLPEKLTGICEHCLMKHHCLGSCIAQNFYRSGSIWAPFWFCEQADILGLFPASRYY